MRPEDNEIRDVRIEEVLAWTSTVGKGKCTEPVLTGPEIPSDSFAFLFLISEAFRLYLLSIEISCPSCTKPNTCITRIFMHYPPHLAVAMPPVSYARRHRLQLELDIYMLVSLLSILYGVTSIDLNLISLQRITF